MIYIKIQLDQAQRKLILLSGLVVINVRYALQVFMCLYIISNFVVEDSATVEKVITQAIKQHSSEYRNPPLLPNNSKGWLLRLAEDDGTPDDGLPALNANQPITKFGNVFALCKNPSYKDDEIGSVRLSKISGGADDLKNQKPLIKINLPNREYHYVPFQGDMKVGQLLVRICIRRKIDAARHQFCIDGDIPADPNKTIEELGAYELTIRPTDKIVAPETTEEQKMEVIWSDAKASQYKQYRVTKLKKNPFAKDEERQIGIDRHLITNDAVKKKGTKRPNRLMKDVTKAGLVGEDKPTQFYITYQEGTTTKEYRYEAQSSSEAKEIVGKIDAILKLENRSNA